MELSQTQVNTSAAQKRAALTDFAVKTAKPKDKAYEMPDGARLYRGLRLVVNPDGTKRWTYRFIVDGKRGKEGLGVYPEMSLAAAREAVLKSKALVGQGIKPTEHKKQVKEARRIAKSNTFEAIAERWFEWRKKKKDLDERNAKKIWASLENHVFPSLGHLPVGDIRPVQCLTIIEAMQGQGIGDQAKRILQRLRGVFDYAVTHQLIEYSPVVSLKTDEVILAKSQKRPSLPMEYMQQFLSDLDSSAASPISKLALRLQILTGVRATELRGAMWTELDFENRLWTIPAERVEVQTSGGGMKMRIAHVVPLSRQSMRIIEQLKTYSGKRAFLFPSPTNPRRCLSDAALSKLMKELGYDGTVEGKPHAVPHGFRTTMKMTALLSKQFLPRAIEFQLAHINPNRVEGAYEAPEDFLEERARMVQWYADVVELAAPNLVTCGVQ